MINTSLISVIIPVYNGQRYLAEAVESVLAQEEHSLEVIVVDDGSTDGSAAVARRYPAVRYCRQPNRGAAAARNRGIELAQGELFAFLDADDLWLPGKLARQSATLVHNPELDAVLGYAEQFLSPELSDDWKARLQCSTAPQPAFHQNAMLIRREAFLRVGLFDTSLQLAEVVDWFARAHDTGLKMSMPSEVVFRRRLHDANQGVTKKHLRQDYVRTLKAALDRRRQQDKTIGNAA